MSRNANEGAGRKAEALAVAVAVLSCRLAASLVMDAPGHVCVEGTRPILRGDGLVESIMLKDWRDRPVGHPIAWRADGTVELPALPSGYYRIACGGVSTTLAVVSRLPQRTRASADAFYAVDSAQSGISVKGSFFCPWNDGDTFRTVSDLIELAGVRHVRDRLRWRTVNPAPGIDPEYSFFMHNAELLHERGVSVSGVFHDCPRWATHLKKLPSDLNAVYEFCRQTACAFGNRMGDWEFWNEPDLDQFSPEPVWDYAAALKAASLGFRAGNRDTVVLPGALCESPANSPYARALFANDANLFCDAFNYHVYLPIAEYHDCFARLRDMLARSGAGNRAIWITESGTNLEGLTDIPSVMDGQMAHSPGQELVVAEFYVKSQIALQMEGVSRNYFFVFGAMNERDGAKDWGVMRRDGTVKPVYSAIATVMREFASAQLLGEMHVEDGVRAYLFERKDGSQSLALWSISPVDTQKGGTVDALPDLSRTVSLSVARGNYGHLDLCGARENVASTNGVLSLNVSRFPSYVTGLRGLSANVPARPRGEVKKYIPSRDEDLAVVVRIDLDPEDFEITTHKSCAAIKGDSGRLRLQVWNFGDSAKTGCVEVVGAKLDGLPSNPIVLGPRGTPPATFDCRLVPDEHAAVWSAVSIRGVFDGKRSSRLFMPLFRLKKFLSSCTAVPLEWQNLNAWEHNTSAQTYDVAWDEAEQALRFDFAWDITQNNRWFYPIYRLNLPQESLAGVRWIEFEVKTAQNKVENDFVAQYLMLFYADKKMKPKYINYTSPIGMWEKRYVDLSSERDLSDVADIRIGANPKGSSCTFWIRNVRLVKERKKKAR